MVYSKLTDIVKKQFSRFNISIMRYDALQTLIESNKKLSESYRRAADDLSFLRKAPDHQLNSLIRNIELSKAQLRQDLFVLSELDFLKNGFFVEFGATNGLSLSNTYLLEKEYGWKGILAEPAKCWHKALYANRTSNIETKCVWSKSNDTITFNETTIAELSTISAFSSSDIHKNTRENGTKYEVETISLNDLLDKYEAPKTIDCLSIDTEGSEFEILSHFDFERYQFRVITCEHNYTPMRQKIYELLTANGYIRKFDDLSQFDDWYVKK